MMEDCTEKTGKELTANNQDIVKYICSIEEERRNLETIIQKQYQERKTVESDIERLTYKLCLINKSLSMRIKAKNSYDKTMEEIQAHYAKLVDSSNKLKQIVEKSQQELDDIMNKKTGTGPNNEEVKLLYLKQNANECPCEIAQEIPIKEKPIVKKSKSQSKVSLAPKPSSATSMETALTADDSSERLEKEVRSNNLEHTPDTPKPRSSGDPPHEQDIKSASNKLRSSADQEPSSEPLQKSTGKNPKAKLSVDEVDKYPKTLYDLDKRRQHSTKSSKTEEISKNILLARLKGGPKSDDGTANKRNSHLTTDDLEQKKEATLDQQHSTDIQRNKLQKRSIQDLLTPSPNSSTL